MKERRSYVRSNGLVLVNYKNTQFEGKSSAFDISGAGLRLTIEQKLQIGTAVQMEIYLPGDSQPVVAKGEIIWVERCPKKQNSQIDDKKEYFYTGIGFTTLDERNKEKIEGYIKRRVVQLKENK